MEGEMKIENVTFLENRSPDPDEKNIYCEHQ